MSILASLLLLHVHVQIEDVSLEVLWVISWSLRLFYHLLRDTAHIEANYYLIFQNTAEFVLLFANVSKFPLTVSKVLTDYVDAWAQVYVSGG